MPPADDDPLGPAEAKEAARPRLRAVVTRLTAAGMLPAVLALATSPILARTLGPGGRGEVAAVAAVIGLAPWLCELGLTAFLSRERAGGELRLGTLLGSTVPLALTAALVGAALAVPISHLLTRGRPVVGTWVEIGLLLLPATVFAQTLYGVIVGDERWGLVVASRVLGAVGSAAAIVALRIADRLDPSSAAAVFVIAAVLANVPFLVALRGAWPPRFERRVARAGIAFGTRSWLSTTAGLANARLDQILMAGLVSSRQLGLYALAVTLSIAPTSFVGATASALLPRVAANGEAELVARACRLTVLLVAGVAVLIAAVSPIAVPIAFGRRFDPMIPMLLVLLAARLFYAAGQVLGISLIGAGNPGATARAQLAGLVVTVPGLIVALPLAGGVGAACVSLVSYAVTFAFVLSASRRTFGLPVRTLLVAHASDVRTTLRRARAVAQADAGSAAPKRPTAA